MSSGLQWAIWGIVMTVVMALVARAWKKQRAGYTGEQLKHPTVILVIGVVCGLPFLAGAVAAAIFAPLKDKWAAAVLLGFAGLGGWLVWEYARVRIAVKPDGFDYRTALQEGTAAWSDVRSIAWSPSMSWFVVKLAGERTLRVSVLLLGLDRLAKALLQNSGAADMSHETRLVLTATANGHPPSPWG